MAVVSFGCKTVTRLRATTVVERGDTVYVWDTPATLDVAGCVFQPIPSEEIQRDRENRDAVIRRWRLITPPGADINEHDRVAVDGVVYEVDGFIQRWQGPTGALAHDELELKRVDG
ncbi:hypothetical protein [Amycolatopsis sp. NPDC003731]